MYFQAIPKKFYFEDGVNKLSSYSFWLLSIYLSISVDQHMVILFTAEKKYSTLSSDTTNKLLKKGKTIGDVIKYMYNGKKHEAEILYIGKYI